MKKTAGIMILALAAGIILSCRTTAVKIESIEKFRFSSFISDKSVTALTLYKDEKGKLSGMITSPFIKGARIEGNIIEGTDDKIILNISRIHLIANWPEGFTKGTAKAIGRITFSLLKKNENGKKYYKACVTESFEILEFTDGEIRYFDDFFVHEDGLKKVADRMIRISELLKFIKEKGNFKEFYGAIYFSTSYGQGFKKELRKFLFDKKTVYPDYLVKLKESGTIKRDYEEASGLFFIDFNIDYYFNKILNNSEFEIIN
jgi:hypothetical protein